MSVVKAFFAKAKDFFAKIEKFSGPLCLSMVFLLAGLTFLNNQLNFDIPASRKVRDAAGFTEPFKEAEKLDLRTMSATVPATNFAAQNYARTPYVSYASTASYVAPAGSDFSIYPVPTSDNSYISPYETRSLSYNGRFFFGHSSNAMNWVKSAGEGNTVSVSGAVYHVVKKQTLPLASVQSVYYSISEFAAYRGKNYDAVIMTCGDGTYGANGNNDAYRTFLFLERA